MIFCYMNHYVKKGKNKTASSGAFNVMIISRCLIRVWGTLGSSEGKTQEEKGIHRNQINI